MSDSTDNTNELDSYGVWVKNNNQEGGDQDEMNFADSLDLPDFEESDNLEDSDFEDMFTEDNTLNLDNPADGETTLTDDELMNITSGDGIEIAEATEENAVFDDDISSDDISFDSLSENSVSDADLSDFDTEIPDTSDDVLSEPEVSIEEPSAESADENIIDDFNFDEITEDTAEPAAVETETTEPEAPAADVTDDFATEDVSEDFNIESSDEEGEQEISLDDFMDSGFSDESVASGNNGFAADAVPAPSGESEEVSLDDFVDMSEFGVTEEAPKKEETIQDEKPLDMDISFDSSADTIQTEENFSVEENIEEDSFDDEPEETVEEETVEEEVVSTGSNDIEAEEIDLSDFGINADAEETPVTQDVESAKNKEAVVDYDLTVGDANMNAAPVVNEIKETASSDELEEISSEPVEAAAPADSSLLQQIVADLSSLKAEINTLKSNLEEMKNAPAPQENNAVISEENAIEEDIIPDTTNDDTGFFSGDDGDDTIALSTDELSNILNTADFNSEEAPAETETPAEEEVSFETEAATEEEAPVQAQVPVFDDSEIENAIDDSEPGVEDAVNNFTAPASDDANLSYDFTDENLSEPNLDDIEIDEESLEDDLPDEISIPKEEDILVESSSSDFMDSVQDTTEEHTEGLEETVVTEPAAAEEPSEQNNFIDDNFSTVDNLFEDDTFEDAAADEPIVEETVIEEAPAEEPVIEETIAAEEPFIEETTVEETPAEDNPFEEAVAEETPVEETFTEEPVIEETVAEEPVIEQEITDDTIIPEPEDNPVEDETFVSEEEVNFDMPDSTVIPEPENDFISHEDENNELTDSNIDYLTTEDKEETSDANDDNAELKKDIKSVLLYMDQLLENLPEEKIVEFAKSEEFTTYKKLFSELGLS